MVGVSVAAEYTVVSPATVNAVIVVVVDGTVVILMFTFSGLGPPSAVMLNANELIFPVEAPAAKSSARVYMY